MPPSFQAPDGQWTTRTAMYRDIQAWAQSSLLSPVRALSVDRNPELERILLDRWPALQVTHAVHPEIDCQHLPFPAGSFDLVFSDQVIEHVPEPWRAASEFERVLKPGGIGIHTTCAFNPRHGPPAFEDYYRFLPAGLAALFKSSSVERLGEWGSREALLHHLEVDEAVAPQIARSFSAEVGEQTDGRYPWVTWIVARLCSQRVPLWEVSAESLWREVAAEEVCQAMRSLLERLTLDPLVTPRILDRMGRPDPRTGKPYIDGRMLLFWLAHRIRPTHVLEVGVRRGFSLAAVSHAAPEAHLVGFDQWMKDYGGVENPGPHFVLEELSRVGHKGPIHLISGDSHQTLPAFFAGKVTLDDGHSLEPPETFQLINIDGDHSIAGSWADLLDVVDRVAPGGALVFDDLNVDYIPEGDFRVGQYGVWTAFKRRFADQFHFLEYLDSIPGLGLAIRYPEPRPDRRILLNTQVGPDAVPPPRVEPEQAEMDLVRELVKPGMTAFDIGAHIGKYTKLFAHLVGPEGRVHAFEPTPTTFKRLQGCWGAESPSQVTLVPKLVTTRPGIFPFHLFPEQYSTWNSLGKPQMADPQAQDRLVPIAKQISVPGTSLDAYCDLQGITEIDYLKLDVEGAESEALGGMEGLLSRQAIRFLQFEISQKPLEGMGHQARETFAMLARHGYVCRPIEAGGRLGPVVFDSDAFYANYLAHKPGDPALEHLIRPTPIHFFTIVLNGRPFIEHHIRELTKLDVPWHWHIVEGVALQRHDSSWMLHHGGRVEENLHRNGLSHDGTTEYLDALARAYPDRITVYRKPHGQAWDGKLEMVNAPLENIQEACLLWQIDADELWTAEQIHEAHRMFEAEPHRRTAVYRCQFFVGPEHVISTRDTYGNPTDRTAWNRTWRYVPGCRWKSHSPPILVEPHKDKWVDLYEEAPFLHEETEARGLVFQHFAYADECQLAFKEVYYGYTGAVEGWRKLQRHDAFPARLREFFPWVQDEALVVPIQELGVTPLAYQTPEGCWQFRGESPLRQEPKKGIRIAGEVDEGHDLTEVSGDSEFATSIRALFSQHRPKRLLETGTYLGQGTTATIARTLDELGIESGRFLSLEVNPSNHRTARKNLSEAGLSHRVDLVNALSVPRDMLPTLEQIDEWTRRNIAYDDIFVDHAEHERAKLYFQETHFESVPDDGLRKALKVLEWRPDFVLLDSGGHMGNVEFNYLLELLEGPCFIALDDVFHIKHRRSLEQIQTDPRFELLTLSHEKFGFCIARFDPGPVPPKPLVEHILWIRLDAIGDALLAASMLEPLRGALPGARISVVCQPHVAELYEACPFVDEVLTVDKARALRDPAHLKAVLADIAGLGADLCLHSVYSREPLADAIAGACGALRRIGHFGDDHNRNPEDRPKLDACYTELVPPGEAWDLELERHRDFLGHLGIQTESLRPCVWTTDEDGVEADRLLREAGLEGRSFIVLFAGAQWDMRVYPRYAEALVPILTDHPDLAVLALGTEKERALSQDILDRLPADALNLCGAVSLRVCAALMGRARVGVGAETGLAHMAAAVGLPHAVVLGGGHFGRFMPYSPLTFSAVLPLDCFLCDWRCIHPRHHCVKDLDPAVLSEAVRRALAAGSDLPCVVAQEGWTAASGGPGALDLEPHLDAARARLVKVAGSAFPHAPVLPGPRPERVAAVTFPHRPLPGNTGAKTRFLSQLSMLRDLGYRTHLLGSSFFSDQPWDPGAIQDLYAQYGALTHLHVGSHPDRVWNQVHALRGLPLDLEKQLVPGYLQAFREMVEGHPPDLLVVNYVEWTGLLDLPGLPEGLVTVQENHDLTSINAVLQAGLAETLGGQPFSLATARPEVLALGFPPRPEPSSLPAFRDEAAALDRFDLVLAISAVEADLVRAEARHAEVLHLPMSFPAKGADGNTYRGQPVFLASPNFFNIQAYLHMAARLAPTFPKGLEVQVIGGIGPLVSPYPHLNLRGYVEDLTSVYRQAPFAICPLLAGTGQQVKIVEAMAHGIPVVAYEGIARSSPIVHGENGLIARTPAEFLQHMGHLWKDRALCKRLGGAALETVRTACSYQRGLEAFERALAARFSAMELP